MMGHVSRGMNGVLYSPVVAALQQADGNHHVQFTHAQTAQRREPPGAVAISTNGTCWISTFISATTFAHS